MTKMPGSVINLTRRVRRKGKERQDLKLSADPELADGGVRNSMLPKQKSPKK
jgi:hypothetical protein